MSGRRSRLSSLLLGALAVAALPGVAGSETSPTIEAVNNGGVYGEMHMWVPSTAAVGPGGTVTFQNTGTVVPHGVVWSGGPQTPSCSGVPLNRGETNWKGSCSFSKPGVYTFYCYVHPSEMKGTITVPGTPAASTGAASEVGQTAATLNGAVKPEGNATSYYFEYHATSGPVLKSPQTSEPASDFAAHPVSASLSGLSPSTEYHVQLVATYATNSTTLGGERTFTTAAPSRPLVTSGRAAAVSESGATLNGTVDPGGAATSYFFEYGPSASYGQQTAPQRAGEDGLNHPVSAALIGLTAATTYHFRLVAENGLGSSDGADETFTTASSPSLAPPFSPPGSTPATMSSTPLVAPLAAATPVASPSGSLLVGGSKALKLTAARHSFALRGSIDVGQAAAGGKLEVALFAASGALAGGKRPGEVLVGRSSRSSLKAGSVSFSVQLTAPARAALQRHKRLALKVRIVLKPAHGAAVTIARDVVLHS
jgi:plastocyanin